MSMLTKPKNAYENFITVTEEGIVKRFEFKIGTLDSADIVKEINLTLATPEWQKDLIGVSLRSYSAKDSEGKASLVFIITKAFGSIENKTKVLREMILDCVNHLVQTKSSRVATTLSSKPIEKSKSVDKPKNRRK